MCNNAHEYSCRLLEAMDAGLISAENLAIMALQYMGEDDVFDMIRYNELTEIVEAV